VHVNARIHLCELNPEGIRRIDIGEAASDATIQAIRDATASGTPLAHVQVYQAHMNAGRTAFRFLRL
jgi:hypothetical protein